MTLSRNPWNPTENGPSPSPALATWQSSSSLSVNRAAEEVPASALCRRGMGPRDRRRCSWEGSHRGDWDRISRVGRGRTSSAPPPALAAVRGGGGEGLLSRLFCPLSVLLVGERGAAAGLVRGPD